MIVNYLRALHISKPAMCRPKDTITLSDFYNISVLLDQFDHSLVYRAAFCLSFYGFLRISNLVGPTQSSFDPTRQLTKEDVSFVNEGVCIYLKWAKNMQKAQQTQVIMLPSMKSHWLCPVYTLRSLFASQRYRACDAVVKTQGGPLTESMLRKRLHLVISMLHMPSRALTYHCLRRSGASLAFNNEVDFECIKSQGGWRSDSVYKYLFANSEKIQQVPKMFQTLEAQL